MEGFVDWTFSTVRCWGEKPQGKWKLVLQDKDNQHENGRLVTWRLTFYGSSFTDQDVQERKK